MALDPYSELGVARDATSADIEKAWLRRRRQVHPDHNPNDPFAAAKFQQAKEAYEILSDPARRRRFDASGDAEAPDVLHERARLLLVEVLSKVIAHIEQNDMYATANVVGSMRDTMLGMLSTGDRNAPKLTKQIAGLERLLKRVRRKEGGESLIATVIQDRIDRLAQSRDANTAARRELVEALKLIDEYEDVEDFMAETDRWLAGNGHTGFISFQPGA